MRAVQRILAVLESFTPQQTCLTLHDIAQRIDLPKSTAFRLLHSLEDAGYLVRLEDQRYCLSFRITRLAGMVKSTLELRELARPLMRELATRTAETVSLHTRSGDSRICIETVATAGPLRSVTQPGEQASLTVGASSKVLLAFASPQQDIAPMVARIARLRKCAAATVARELVRVREQGYAVSHGERVLGVASVSAPVRGVEPDIHYCLSVAGPMVRMQARQADIIRWVVDTAAEISWLYGASAR